MMSCWFGFSALCRMTQVTEQQEETRPWQQYELFQLTIKIEPLLVTVNINQSIKNQAINQTAVSSS